MKKPTALKTMFLSLAMVSLLSGCAKGGNEGFSPIYINKDDQLTDGTARQILEHNELGHIVYGW